MGYRVLRFWNHDVLTETESILEIILNELNKALSEGGNPQLDTFELILKALGYKLTMQIIQSFLRGIGHLFTLPFRHFAPGKKARPLF